MQLKRDVDYSLRILLCIMQNKKLNTEKCGMTVFELSRLTDIPVTIVSRLCKKMQGAKWLKAIKPTDGNVKYTYYNDTRNKTLFDVIQVVEGHSDLFSVFDKSTDFYSSCKAYFDSAEQKFVSCLTAISIQELKDALNEEKIHE